jgi:hypothetical protein
VAWQSVKLRYYRAGHPLASGGRGKALVSTEEDCVVKAGPPLLQDKWSWGTRGRGPGHGGDPSSECVCILH